jgi:hypothetical protein
MSARLRWGSGGVSDISSGDVIGTITEACLFIAISTGGREALGQTKTQQSDGARVRLLQPAAAEG